MTTDNRQQTTDNGQQTTDGAAFLLPDNGETERGVKTIEVEAMLALIMPSRDGRKDAKRLNGQWKLERSGGAERVSEVTGGGAQGRYGRGGDGSS